MSEFLEQIIEQEEDTQKGKHLIFDLEGEYYGLDIRYVIEIIGMQKITMVPELPDYVKGIINLRGNIIPVIDVRKKFNKEEKDYTDRTCIIVIQVNEISIGLVVDKVSEVLTISENEIVPPPDVKTGFKNKYIKGISNQGDNVKLLLDCEKLLSDQELSMLDKV